MKRFRNLKKYPLILLIVISTLFFSLLGYLGKSNIYADYTVDLLKTPQLAVVFEGIKDDAYPWDLLNYDKKQTSNASTGGIISVGNEIQETTTENSNTHEEMVDIKTPGESSNLVGQKDTLTEEESNTSVDLNTEKNTSEQDSEDGNDSDKSTFQFKKVKKNYFDDALFIGDSRTVGLSEYSGWDKPTYYADVGLTIYDVFDKKVAEVNGKKLTIDKALEKKQFKKIYIMLGINELGRGTTKTFIKEYKEVIAKIQKLQPDAIIFVEAIMNVSTKKSNSDPIFNNKNIKDKNDHLALLADNKNIFYIDVNEAITDETGGIPEEYTFDNIHLKAAYYKIWTKFLIKHGILKE